jgi:hypothetical protein
MVTVPGGGGAAGVLLLSDILIQGTKGEEGVVARFSLCYCAVTCVRFSGQDLSSLSVSCVPQLYCVVHQLS